MDNAENESTMIRSMLLLLYVFTYYKNVQALIAIGAVLSTMQIVISSSQPGLISQCCNRLLLYDINRADTLVYRGKILGVNDYTFLSTIGQVCENSKSSLLVITTGENAGIVC